MRIAILCSALLASRALLLVPGTLLLAESSPICRAATQEVALASSLASAGLWANALGRDHSVSAQVERLLLEAIQKVSTMKTPPSECFDDCDQMPAPLIQITSTPNKTLLSENAKAECSHYETFSEKSPFLAKHMEFTNFDDLNDWVGDFSRGQGEEGEKLYKYCPGKCSPRYTYSVTVSKHNPSDDSGLFYLKSVATCGLPRDTDDDQYLLKTSYTWKCPHK